MASTILLLVLSMVLSVPAVAAVVYFTVSHLKSSSLLDYAALSGVPLPKALPNFDITKARPRPYRPFRWVYHQHMCAYSPRSAYV
jgi:hypothetical protein